MNLREYSGSVNSSRHSNRTYRHDEHCHSSIEISYSSVRHFSTITIFRSYVIPQGSLRHSSALVLVQRLGSCSLESCLFNTTKDYGSNSFITRVCDTENCRSNTLELRNWSKVKKAKQTLWMPWLIVLSPTGIQVKQKVFGVWQRNQHIGIGIKQNYLRQIKRMPKSQTWLKKISTGQCQS